MRFFTQRRTFYCGIDLHAKKMFVCILNDAGEIVLHRNLPTDGEVLKRTLAPFRDGLVVGVECMFSWYWLADLCAKENIPFVLGHALYMKAIHGGKTKNDELDSEKIAQDGVRCADVLWGVAHRVSRAQGWDRQPAIRVRVPLLCSCVKPEVSGASRLDFGRHRDGVQRIRRRFIG